jgi:hypothetical protein
MSKALLDPKNLRDSPRPTNVCSDRQTTVNHVQRAGPGGSGPSERGADAVSVRRWWLSRIAASDVPMALSKRCCSAMVLAVGGRHDVMRVAWST